MKSDLWCFQNNSKRFYGENEDLDKKRRKSNALK